MTENASTQAAEAEAGVFLVRIGTRRYDNHNYAYTLWDLLWADGYFASAAEAQVYADAVELERNASRYESYLRTTTAELRRWEEEVAVRAEQNRVLAEAGLPGLEAIRRPYVMQFASEPKPFKVWLAEEIQSKVWFAEVVEVGTRVAVLAAAEAKEEDEENE